MQAVELVPLLSYSIFLNVLHSTSDESLRRAAIYISTLMELDAQSCSVSLKSTNLRTCSIGLKHRNENCKGLLKNVATRGSFSPTRNVAVFTENAASVDPSKLD